MTEEDIDLENFVFIAINVMRRGKTFPKKLIVSTPRSISLLRVSMAIPLHLLSVDSSGALWSVGELTYIHQFR